MNAAQSPVDRTDDTQGRPSESDVRRALVLARLLSLGILGALMLRIAWISDDSLITLRTALNLAHGWGAGFNATEAVQAYTHPLWFLLWLFAGIISHEWLLTIVALGVGCSLAAAAIALRSARCLGAVIMVAAALVFSNAFMEYTTSGLENPLAYLLVGTTLVLSLHIDGRACRMTSGRFLLLGLSLAGVALTRLDLLLIALPAALVFTWQHRTRSRALLSAAVGFILPPVAWFTWSHITYAALLPNTFEAKRNLMIPQAELLVQGCRYLWVSIEHDPVTGLVIAGGLLIVIAWGSRLHRAWAAGVPVYIAYLVYIGGDFMAGRFLAVPVYLLVLLAACNPVWDLRGAVTLRTSTASPSSLGTFIALIVVTMVALLLATAQRYPVALLNPDLARWDYEEAAGVADERGFYMKHSRGIIALLLTLGAPTSVPPFQPVEAADVYAPLSDIREAANEWPDRRGPPLKMPTGVGVKCGLLGSAGIMTGPTVHWVDRCALTDRFLAQQPYAASGFDWRVGHYLRRVPEGYREAIAANDPSLVPDAAEGLRLADLWSAIRD